MKKDKTPPIPDDYTMKTKKNCKYCSGTGIINYIDATGYRLGRRQTQKRPCHCARLVKKEGKNEKT